MHDRRDTLTVLLTLVHAAALATWPSVPTVAIGLWWNANAISHQHVHRAFFRRRGLDAAFSAWLSLLLGLPQRLWRARHLAHHAGTAQPVNTAQPARSASASAAMGAEVCLVLGLWSSLALTAPSFLLATYLPGFALGLVLCRVHGHYEHRGSTTSCYGRFWNLLFLNDGYHVEHHAHPRAHVFDLPRRRIPGTPESRWPPLLRFLDGDWLDQLERLVLRCPPLRRSLLATHRRALRAVLRHRTGAGWAPRRVAIVGGGLFPRSALLIGELFPSATIVVLDAEPRHLLRARALLPCTVEMRCARFTPGERLDCDLAIVPLALRGDRDTLYRQPPAPLCLVHDWLWRRRGTSAVVACWLLKRVNLVCCRPQRLHSRRPRSTTSLVEVRS